MCEEPDLEIERISDLVAQFRILIQQANRAQLPASMAFFPAGSCEYSSLLLQRFLSENGEDGFILFCCPQIAADNWQSHAWLQRGTMVADITLDQFEWVDQPTFVQRDSAWHSGLQVSIVDGVAQMGFPSSTLVEMNEAYNLIVSGQTS